MDLFEKNLKKFSKTDPKMGVLLPFLERETHSFSEESSVIYVFGLPTESFFQEMKGWLKGQKEKAVVFLEDDRYRLKDFLETSLASKVLSQKRMHLIAFPDLEGEFPYTLDELMWHFVRKKIEVIGDPYYEKTRKEAFQKIKERLSFETEKLKLILEEYFILGAPFFYNFYKNIVKLKDSYLGDKLFQKFKKVPAIIVGAGPSLEKQIPLLKRLKGKALIFAGGSSMNALNAFDLMPHFGAGIDPNLEQKKRLETHQGCHLPHFYRHRMNEQAFDLLKGPKLYITGSGGYEIGRYFDEVLGFKSSEVDEGHNVVNFLTEISLRMGCSPIVYVGLDLSLTGGKEYSSFEKEESASSDERILRKDIFGQPTYTYWKWIAESSWISAFVKAHEKTKFYNATEGGIGIEGVENVSLERFEKVWKPQKELEKKIEEEIHQAKCSPKTEKKVQETLRALYQSFEKCEALLKKLNEKGLFSQKGEEIEKTLLEEELLNEVAYTTVLATFNLVATKLFSFEWKQASPLKKLKIGRKKIKILLSVARFNKALIKRCL